MLRHMAAMSLPFSRPHFHIGRYGRLFPLPALAIAFSALPLPPGPHVPTRGRSTSGLRSADVCARARDRLHESGHSQVHGKGLSFPSVHPIKELIGVALLIVGSMFYLLR